MVWDNFTLISFSILIVICLFVLYCVIRIIVQIVASVRKDRLPKPQLNHPELGVITFDSGLWITQWEHDGGKLRFTVAGTIEGPMTELVATTIQVFKNISTFKEAALDFLLANQPENHFLQGTKCRIDRGMFNLEGVVCLWEERPHDFWLEFELIGDLDGFWRVEFQDGIVTFSGRDD